MKMLVLMKMVGSQVRSEVLARQLVFITGRMRMARVAEVARIKNPRAAMKR